MGKILYEIKDWFANKIAQEVKRNITCCDIFNIFKETEKAVYALVCIGCNSFRTMWVPKSVLIETEGRDNNYTHYIEDYNEAVKEFKSRWYDFV